MSGPSGVKHASVSAGKPIPTLNRRGFLLLVTRLLPALLILAPRRCNPPASTPTHKPAGYGSGRYGAGRYA